MRWLSICAAASIAALCAHIALFAWWTGWQSDPGTASMELRPSAVAVATLFALASYAVTWLVRHRSAHRSKRIREQAARRAAAWATAFGIGVFVVGHGQIAYCSHCGGFRPSLWDFGAYFLASIIVLATQRVAS